MFAVQHASVADATPIEMIDPTGEQLYKLGLSYSTGQGAPLDLVEAHKWFNLAAMKGSHEAKAYRTELAEQMTKSEIAAAQRAAREWLSGKAH